MKIFIFLPSFVVLFVLFLKPALGNLSIPQAETECHKKFNDSDITHEFVMALWRRVPLSKDSVVYEYLTCILDKAGSLREDKTIDTIKLQDILVENSFMSVEESKEWLKNCTEVSGSSTLNATQFKPTLCGRSTAKAENECKKDFNILKITHDVMLALFGGVPLPKDSVAYKYETCVFNKTGILREDKTLDITKVQDVMMENTAMTIDETKKWLVKCTKMSDSSTLSVTQFLNCIVKTHGEIRLF
ncbi:hypothetical protein ILUMI_05271 [Ignelater luminosus]|uniref:Uncharacterized protein n=1 Tax=Ignelater luminosus TaxID=2038154 RepID=A0A8K0GDQ8_IGNLU|nr:hypothetical protein ILUMI_05271 [Ignelater luminosus]